MRGAHHVLSLLMPYLEPAGKSHLQRLAGADGSPESLPA